VPDKPTKIPRPGRWVKLIVGGCAVVSLAATGYGFWLHYPPAGYFVPGLLLWIALQQMGNGA